MLKKNDKIVVDIDDIGINGEGIAHYDGDTVFIPFALKGERVEALIVLTKKGFYAGKVLNILVESKDRVLPRCPYFTRCGGCELQHMKYQASLGYKSELVKQTIKKVGGLDVLVEPCISAENEYGYRNKVAFPVIFDGEKTVIGMFRKNSHNIIDIENCSIQKPFANVLISIIREYIEKFEIKGYDETTKKGILRYIVAREVDGVVLLTLVVTTNKIKGLDFIIDKLKGAFKSFGLNLNININDNNVILSDKFEHIFGEKELTKCEFGIEYPINSLSFMQINDDIKEKIYNQVIENVDANGVVIDAYSGAGLLTAILSKKCKKAIGIEIVQKAVDNANALKEKNRISNMENYCGDCAILLPKILEKVDTKTNIVLDPPRSGCDKLVIKAIVDSDVEKILYISCSPQTLARDLKILCETKYKILFVKPYDMFPQTKHVETLVCLKKI